MASGVEFKWNGLTIQEQANRAKGRGLVGIGMSIATEGKRNADVISGTMRRSIHVAELNYTGGDDLEVSTGTDPEDQSYGPPNITIPTYVGGEAALEVGSWVPYACVEEVGRGHTFMQPAVEVVQGARAEALMIKAFAEEGLA